MPDEMFAALLIPVLPLFGFLALVFWGSFAPRVISVVSTGMLTISTILAGYLYFSVTGGSPIIAEKAWFTLSDFTFSVGFMVDGLSVTLAFAVSIASLMVHLYSFAHLKDSGNISRFYTFAALLTASMLTLVFASNFLVLLVAWEGVGISAYGLMGAYSDTERTAKAGGKGFVLSRLGSLSILAGILLLLFYGSDSLLAITDSTSLAPLSKLGLSAANGASVLNFTALGALFENAEFIQGFSAWILPLGVLLLVGIISRSALFPLHAWVSGTASETASANALVHASVTVLAGLFILMRIPYIFSFESVAGIAAPVLIWVGAATAFIAATIAMRIHNIKRILTYAAVSQSGFVIAAAGLGSTAAALFHACCSSLFLGMLLLASGGISRAYGTTDIRDIRGVASRMSVTAFAFLIGVLAASGFPFITAGFFSKRAILSQAYAEHPLVFWVLILATSFTAFYMFRVYFSIYSGEPKAGHKPDESPSSMIYPLLLLAAFLIGFGFIGGRFAQKLGAELPAGTTEMLILFIAFVLGGMLLAWVLYSERFVSAERMSRIFGPISTFIKREWFWQKMFDDIVLAFTRAGAALLNSFDKFVVDDLYTSAARFSVHLGTVFRQLQTGLVQMYLFAMAVALLVLIFIFNLIRMN